MAAPPKVWSARLSEVGDVGARRVYGQLAHPEPALRIAESALAAGRMPVVSFKVPGTDWAGAAAGRYDDALERVTDRLAAPGGRVFVTLHHEPAGDGLARDYAAMMKHALPILGAPANVRAGPIVNGFWWSSTGAGLDDSEIARWLPRGVLNRSEIVAADTYQTRVGDRVREEPAVKIKNLSAWARRVGVRRLGVGEYNASTGPSVKAAGLAVLSDPRIKFAMIFNSNANNPAGRSLQLDGRRLNAFRSTLAVAERRRKG